MSSDLTANANRLAELKAFIDKWLGDAHKVGEALTEIKEKQLWITPGGPATYAEYVENEWGISARKGRDLVQRFRQEGLSADKLKGLPSVKVGESLIELPPSQRRMLEKVPEHLQAKVVTEAARLAKVKPGVASVTKTHLADAAKTVREAEETAPEPDSVASVRADKDLVESLVHSAYTIMRKLQACQGRESMIEMDVAEAVARMTEFIREVKDGSGYCECLYCDRDTKERETCEACGGKGWVSRRIYDRASIKRQKTAKLV